MQNEGFFNGPPKMMFVFGLVSGVAVAAILGLFLSSGNMTFVSGSTERFAAAPEVPPTPAVAPSAAPAPVPSGALPEVTEDDWVKGDLSKAKVVMVEYSDYECPFCQRFHPTMQAMVDQYGDDVAWVYRHFPLGFHANANPAALAAECAGEQGGDEAFWEFSDILFAGQRQLGTALYEQGIQDLGLDLSEFQSCFSEGRYEADVTTDHLGGQSAGVTGTPGTFINGRLVSGAVPASQIQAIVESFL